MNGITFITPLFRVSPRIVLPLLIALHLAVLVLIVTALGGEDQYSGSSVEEPYYASQARVAPLHEDPVRAECEPDDASSGFAVHALADFRQPEAAGATQNCVNFY